MRGIARLLALAVLAAGTSSRAEPESVRIELESPAPGAISRGVQGIGFLSGRAVGHSGDLDVTDLMIVIDVSDSTLGEQADEEVLVEIAKVSGGRYTPVMQPGHLRAEVASVDLVDVAGLEIENLASGAGAARIARAPDGRFFALLAMQPGRNPIQITARTLAASTRKRFEVEFAEDADVATGAPEDPTAARMRSELFSTWLAERASPAGVAP